MRASHQGTTLAAEQQPPRKKIRKGTRSCWECKHRKVRCHFLSDADNSCRECLARGIQCRSQDLPEPENVRESERASVNDRLGRVEYLLERVLQRLDAGHDVEHEILRSVSVADDSSDAGAGTTPANENAPILSLFNNGVLGFQREDASMANTANSGMLAPNRERLCSQLLNLIPSRNTLQKLEGATSSWWLLRVQCFGDYEKSLLPHTEMALSKKSPVKIAKAALWVAIALQQLPRTFDISLLELRCHPSKLIAECVNTVTQSISYDEARVSSLDGLECLVLQGIFYNNDGKLRSAWLSYRRALSVAQIIGFHRFPPDTKNDSESVKRGKQIWHHIIYADRYLSLMLGMWHGITDVSLASRGEVAEISKPSLMHQLCRIAGLIIERNQTFQTVTPAMIQMTQSIDSELKSMDVPFVIESSAISSEKSTDRVRHYSQLMTHLWYYQLLAWLHLPLLLEAHSQGRYEYSIQSCLEASRYMITSYNSIRRLTANSFCCKSLDFQAFTAAVTLMINVIGSGIPHQSSVDWPSIENVMKSLEILAEGQPPDKVATRGLGVLRTLENVAMGTMPMNSTNSKETTSRTSQSSRMKVEIPYFGTICLDCHLQRGSVTDLQPHLVHEEPANNCTMPSFGIIPETTAVHYQLADLGPWLGTSSIDLDSADMWTTNTEMSTLLPFFTNTEDSWNLGL